MKLKDKHIFITGANRGIGNALAQEAAKKNLHVHAVCRNPKEELKESLLSLGASSARLWKLDMNEPEQIDQFVSDIKKENIPVHILVNNAGLLTGGLIEEQDTRKIYDMIQVNLTGLIHLTKELLPHMQQLTEAKIVNNASVSGKMFFPCASTYAASKAGVVGFTECIKQELRGTSVSTLLLITPGVETTMFNDIPDLYSSHLKTDFLTSISAAEWAKRVFHAIENDSDTCWPEGQTWIGVKLGHHLPSVFERIVKPYFKR